MNATQTMVGSWEIEKLSVPLRFAAYAEAYLVSSIQLCKALIEEPKETTYERGAVVMYLAFHATELFLKALILNKEPKEKLNHNIEHYIKRYKNLYPPKRFRFEIPFKTEYLGFSHPEIEEIKKTDPPTDQIHRYPADKKGIAWAGLYAFDAAPFLETAQELQDEFNRIKLLAFNG